MNIRRNMAYAAVLVSLGSAAGGAMAERYLAVRPLQEELAVQESNSREIRGRLGRCYSDGRRSYVINPDMSVTVWDVAGDRRIRLSELQR